MSNCLLFTDAQTEIPLDSPKQEKTAGNYHSDKPGTLFAESSITNTHSNDSALSSIQSRPAESRKVQVTLYFAYVYFNINFVTSSAAEFYAL